MAIDFDEAVGQVRVLIPDLVQLPDPADPTGPKSYIFSDAEIQAFLNISGETSYGVKRAAAYAMIAIANTENLILKKIVSQDQQTDGPAVAKQMIAAAQTLLARADAEEKVLLDVVQTEPEGFFAVFPSRSLVDQHTRWPEGTNEGPYVYGLKGIY